MESQVHNKHKFSEKGTIGETFVNNIAFKSFMKYWCYPNPKDVKGDKKEICDLMIIFKNIIILICVKNYLFKENYDRYFHKSIEKDCKQLLGAERKLRASEVSIIHPDRTNEEIVKIDNLSNVYRITVHLGDDVQYYPACNTINSSFIHVFDRIAFEEMMQQLDTMPDFIEYLDNREKIFLHHDVLIMPDPNDTAFEKSDMNQFLQYHQDVDPMSTKRIIINGREADLLALYLKNNREFDPKYWGGTENYLAIEICGEYDEFCKRKEVEKKRVADKVSYFIDDLVRDELLACSMSIEIAKELMSFNRFDRRCISQNILDFIGRYNSLSGNRIGRRFGMFGEMAFALVFYTSELREQEGELDALIELAFDSYIIRHKYQMRKMLLMAITTNMEQFKFMYRNNITPFPKEVEKETMLLATEFGWFAKEELIGQHQSEYPE